MNSLSEPPCSQCRPIPLSQGFMAWVSPEDFRRVMKRKWSVLKKKNGDMYAQTNMKVEGRWIRVLLHRFILEPPAGIQVDHRNGNGLDCTRENMRLATHGQNIHNQKPRAGSSKFKGVSRCTKNRWMAQITSQREYRYLGLFANEEDAAKAYDVAAKQLHGDFAKLNFPGAEAEQEVCR